MDQALTSKRCYLGLGGNITNELGSPSQHIHNAIQSLEAHPKITQVKASSLYASKPMGPQDQPDFINAVVELDTTLVAHESLILEVPHPGITQRNFVLIPLYELNPTVEVNGVPIADLEQSQDWSGLTRLS